MKPALRFSLFILSNLFVLTTLYGQTDTALISSLYRQATSELDQLHFENAREICLQLLEKLDGRDSFSISSRIKTLMMQGSMFRHESRYAEAKQVFYEALNLAKMYFEPDSYEQAITYYHMAWINEQAFDLEGWKSYLDSAAFIFQKAFSPDDCWNGRIWQGRARMNFYNSGPPDSTLIFLRKATTIYNHCPGGAPKNEFDLAKIYYDVYLSLRQFDSAAFYLKLQIDYTNTQNGIMWDIQRAWMELTKGNLYRLNGQYEKAISEYQYAKTLFESLDKDTVPLISCELYTALCMNGIGKTSEALILFKKLNLLARVYTQISPDMLGLIYEGTARTHASAGNCDSAISYAEKSLQVFSLLVQPANPKLFNLYLVYGQCLSKLEEYEKADSVLQLAYGYAAQFFGTDHPFPVQINLERAISSIRRGDFQHGKTILDALSQLTVLQHSPELAYQHTITTAQLQVRQTGKHKITSSDRTTLISLLYTAMQQFRDIRNQYITEETRARSVATSIASLHIFMPLLFEYYNLDSNKDLYRLMLQISELHRGLILSEAMVQSEAYVLAGIPADLQNDERKLKSSLYQIRKKIDQEYTRAMPKKDYISQLLAQQIGEQTKLDQLIETFQKKYPAYFRAKFAHGTVSVDQIQNKLLPDEVIAEYLVVGNAIYIFIISHNSSSVFLVDDGNSIIAKTSEFVELISQFTLEPDRQKKIDLLGKDLYRKLISPFSSMLTSSSSLIIIPDRVLYYFPFELLRIEPTSGEPSSEKQFLIYQHAIQYQSSLLLWMDQWENEDVPVRHALAVSPSFAMNENGISTRSALMPLDYAENESSNLHELWGGKWLSKGKASKSNFIREASRSDMIHLATHARADDRSGVFSWLAFSPSSHDSLLYLDEIYGLILDARIVVLSGCETGIGPLQTGEGLISLSRAFSYAGAESMITSLWSVHDEATSIIMTSFYKYLKEGKSKDRALQLAKIEYLENISDPTQADPYYWAGFIAMGDMSPLTLANRLIRPWMIAAFIIAGGVAVLLLFKYFKR